MVCHCPSENTLQLRDSAVKNLNKMQIKNLELRVRLPLETYSDDIKWCNGIIIGTTENFGNMAGLTKDFFERTYYPCLESKQGLPCALYIRAGEDGTGTEIAIRKIFTGLRWKLIAKPLILKGNWKKKFIDETSELVMTMAAGLENSIY